MKLSTGVGGEVLEGMTVLLLMRTRQLENVHQQLVYLGHALVYLGHALQPGILRWQGKDCSLH